MAGETTIPVTKLTLDRFNKQKRQFAAMQNQNVDADTFINALLEGFEVGTKVMQAQQSADLQEVKE